MKRVRITNVQLVREGEFLLNEVTELFLAGLRHEKSSVISPTLKADCSECHGVKALLAVCDQFGLAVVQTYMTLFKKMHPP